jgi:hypothetical protein
MKHLRRVRQQWQMHRHQARTRYPMKVKTYSLLKYSNKINVVKIFCIYSKRYAFLTVYALNAYLLILFVHNIETLAQKKKTNKIKGVQH